MDVSLLRFYISFLSWHCVLTLTEAENTLQIEWSRFAHYRGLHATPVALDPPGIPCTLSMVFSVKDSNYFKSIETFCYSMIYGLLNESSEDSETNIVNHLRNPISMDLEVKSKVFQSCFHITWAE